MKLKSHLLVARNIYELVKDYIDVELDLDYFLIGCVMPDISPSSRFEKHCLDSAEIKIKRIIEGLPKYGVKKFSYELGKITHYLADTFCLPHNNFFMDLKKHYKYEALTKKIQNDYELNRDKVYNFINDNLDDIDMSFINKLNKIYLSDIPKSTIESIFRDFDYSIEIGTLMVISLVNQYAALNNICEGPVYL